MSGLFEEKLFGIPWAVLALAGVVLAVSAAFLSDGGAAEGGMWWLLRWGRSAAWLLLAGAALIRAKVTSTPLEMAAPLAGLGGLIYGAVMLATP